MSFVQIKNLTLLFLLLGLIISTGCSKDDEETTETANVNVYLKSTVSSEKSSATYESVKLDIQQVFYHNSSDTAATSGWFELETEAGIYDLLQDTPGIDTLLAFDSTMQVQKISQIRLVLGNSNSITNEGETHSLETPSGQTSGIKVQVHADLEAEKNYRIVLDFDVDKSILKTGNGKYKLKPVINASVVEE